MKETHTALNNRSNGSKLRVFGVIAVSLSLCNLKLQFVLMLGANPFTV